MDTKKYLLAVLVVFIAHSALGYLIHNLLLSKDYETLNFVREFGDFAAKLPFLYLANLIFAAVLCFIYTRAYEPGQNWFLQGLVFGLLIGLLFVPATLIGYVTLPLSGWLTLKLGAMNFAHILFSALVAAAFYRLPPPLHARN